MTARFDQLERSFRAAETLLGLRITVIDNAHVFATPVSYTHLTLPTIA